MKDDRLRVNVSEAIRDATLIVEIRDPMGVALWRLRLAKWLILLAGRIGGFGGTEIHC